MSLSNFSLFGAVERPMEHDLCELVSFRVSVLRDQFEVERELFRRNVQLESC